MNIWNAREPDFRLNFVQVDPMLVQIRACEAGSARSVPPTPLIELELPQSWPARRTQPRCRPEGTYTCFDPESPEGYRHRNKRTPPTSTHHDATAPRNRATCLATRGPKRHNAHKPSRSERKSQRANELASSPLRLACSPDRLRDPPQLRRAQAWARAGGSAQCETQNYKTIDERASPARLAQWFVDLGDR